MEEFKRKPVFFNLNWDKDYKNCPLNNFLNKRNYKIDPLELITGSDGKCDYVESEYVDQILKHFGFTIEVTEMSTAEKAIGSIEGRDWRRINKFRWELAIWDEFGTMIGLEYSDNNIKFNSENEAFENAANFVLNNY